MVEVKDGKKILTTPISAEDLKGIKIGDIIYLNGSMTTCRDVAHRRLVEEGRELPVDVRNNAIFALSAAVCLSTFLLFSILFQKSGSAATSSSSLTFSFELAMSK